MIDIVKQAGGTSPAPTGRVEHPVEFHGTAGEFFGIWIVNVLLSIVTLGIYGAWAKVRTKKYFYGQTSIDSHNFDYHATGLQIFIGRVIVVLALILLGASQFISIFLYMALILVLLVVLPFIIIRALRFNARVSSYRNVRFNFDGTYGGGFIAYFLLPIANIFTLYLATPFVTRQANRFTVNGHEFGDRPFSFDSQIGPYYKAFLFPLFAFIAFLVVAGILGAGVFAGAAAMGGAPNEAAMVSLVLFVYLGLFVIVVPAALYYAACVRNIIFNNAVLDGRHTFRSEVNPFRYAWIIISNTIAAIFTLGLLIPWGRVRLAKYLASKTFMIADGSLSGYSSEVIDTAGVMSSEYVDMEGFDVGLGI